MARLARVVIPGVPHHITQRGVRSMRIFFSDQDRTDYLQLLGHYSEIYGLHLASYTLMDNHILCRAQHNLAYVKFSVM
jgi:putative transposase